MIEQNQKIKYDDDHETQPNEYIKESALFYIILNGTFKASSLRFNKRKKE